MSGEQLYDIIEKVVPNSSQAAAMVVIVVGFTAACAISAYHH
jgi:uncharacterized membrane protein YuzA (DUF378 family)